uniref:Cytochrome b n=1 Tax=Clathrina clathrus TaxID=1031547 RepID=L0HQR3_CLACL|nr:cytochrome b [Clathrina clathrus]
MPHSRLKNLNLTKGIIRMLIDLASPINLSYLWNLRSILRGLLLSQVITRIFLAMYYTPTSLQAFDSTVNIMKDVRYGWLIRYLHLNRASFFFMALYLHLRRALYYSSWRSSHVWSIRVTILILSMATAFLRYVLPYRQMSYWAATVIINLLSAIPVTGSTIVIYLWGRYSVSTPTLNRFLSLHYLLPFIIILLVIIHISLLHRYRSTNPLSIRSDANKIPFYWGYITKDLYRFLIVLTLLEFVLFFHPHLFSDPQNFIKANSLVTPTHIKPEWYFLFAYAILRSIPNKLGRVIALISSLAIFYCFSPQAFNPHFLAPSSILRKILFWTFIHIVLLLSILRALPIEEPFIFLNSFLTPAYYLFLTAILFSSI